MAPKLFHYGQCNFFLKILRSDGTEMVESGIQFEIELAGHPLVVTRGELCKYEPETGSGVG